MVIVFGGSDLTSVGERPYSVSCCPWSLSV